MPLLLGAFASGAPNIAAEELPGVIRGVVNESKVVSSSIHDSVLVANLQAPSGRGAWAIQLSVGKDEASAKKSLEYDVVMIPVPSTIAAGLGDEARIWNRGTSGGTIIFRRGPVVATISGVLDWKELYDAAVALDKEVASVSAETLREQFAVLEKGAAVGKMVETQAKSALSAEDRQKAVTALTSQLLTTKDDGERQKALVELGSLGDYSAVGTLLTFVDARHSNIVRSQAIKALARLGAKEAVPMLIEILQQPATGNLADEGEKEAIIRRQAVTALGKIGDRSALPVLNDVQNREKEYRSVKELAGVSLQEIGE